MSRGLRDHRGRVAIVTGASSGIGAQTARSLARAGAHVVLVARREAVLREIADDIAREGGRADVHAADVGDRSAVEAVVADVAASCGRIDELFNCAGFARHVLFRDHEVDDIERTIATNLLGTIHFIQSVLPHMTARGEGWIVNVSSFAGQMGQPDEAVYSASKFAVTGLSQAIGPELEPSGIHVLCVHPVLVRTAMFTEEVLARMPERMSSGFIEVDRFVDQMLAALARGEREVTLPRRYGWVPLLRALFPKLVGGAAARVKLEPLRERLVERSRRPR